MTRIILRLRLFGMEELDIPAEILRLEAIAYARGFTVSDVCREIPMHRGTWQRWKDGDCEPKAIIWNRVVRTVEGLKIRK